MSAGMHTLLEHTGETGTLEMSISETPDRGGEGDGGDVFTLGTRTWVSGDVSRADLRSQVALSYIIREPTIHASVYTAGDFSRLSGLSLEVLGGNVFGIPTKHPLVT